ncbi:MAG: hypothetical protein MI924_25110 [Chloroflexales bacterium]|nr:hypothetical protein [Chloroflexales bacterium]
MTDQSFTAHVARPFRWQAHLVALGAYLLCTLLIMAPILPLFNRAILGGPVAAVDGWLHVWHMWWAHRAVTTGVNPFYTNLLYYPQGADLAIQPMNLSNGVLVLPITALFGPIAGYNLAAMLAFVLAGMGGYALALRITGSWPAAFLGGFIFSFSPFHMTKLADGQLELIALQWLPFYQLFLLRTVEASWRYDAVVAGGLLALIGYTSWYYFLFACISSCFFGLLWLFTVLKKHDRIGAIWRLFVIVLIAGFCIAPILAPALINSSSDFGQVQSVEPHSNEYLVSRSANILDFWLPSNLHPIWGDAVVRVGQAWHPGIAAWNVALGYCTLGLAVVGLITSWAKAWRWALLALAMLILALGPLLSIGSWQTALPLPYGLLLYVPGLDLAQRPSHFVVIVTLMLAILAAFGMRWLLDRAARQVRWIVLLGVFLIIGFEYLPPRWSIWDSDVHPFYTTLADQDGALLVLPAQQDSSVVLKAQMVHSRPLIGGYLARVPHYRVPFAPGIRQFWDLEIDTGQMLAGEPSEWLAGLQFYDISHIIVLMDQLTPAQRSSLDAVLNQLLPNDTPSYADHDLRVYAAPAVEDRPFAYFSNGWYAEESTPPQRWRWMQAEGSIVLANPLQEVRTAISLEMESYQIARMIEVFLDSTFVDTWHVDAQPVRIKRTLHLLLPPGETILTLRATTSMEPVGTQNRYLSIALVNTTVRWQ